MAETDDRRAVARFFAETIGGDASYISHGEIQGGLSPDGRSWAPDLATLFAEDLAVPDPGCDVLLLRDGEGGLVAAAIVRWVESTRTRYAIIEDLSVRPDARSRGAGKVMADAIEDAAKRRRMAWIFLESGRDNVRAHRFFERSGFREVSHVFAKRL